MDYFKRIFNTDQTDLSLNPFSSSDENDRFNFGNYCQLSYKHRIYGFGICFGVGLLFSFLGIVCLFFMNFVGFGITYSLGNICMIVSTLFLFGPINQIKSMFSSIHRGVATGIFLLAIIMTLVAAFAWHSAGLCILFLIIQVAAFVWYMITSFPGGQTICCSCVKSVANV